MRGLPRREPEAEVIPPHTQTPQVGGGFTILALLSNFRSGADMSLSSNWFTHDGRACPVQPDQKVQVRYRNGVESDVILARERRWEAWPSEVGESDWEIVAWRAETGQGETK